MDMYIAKNCTGKRPIREIYTKKGIKRNRTGSITVFLALILSLLLSLVCTSIESVRMASARTQILNGMDIGLYSLFGQYDKKLLEDYDLFAFDGSVGGGQLNLAAVSDNLESYIKPVLKQNSQKLELKQSGFTGYRLLTDENGEVFYQQIVQYMQETLGSQGVQLLLNRMSEREKKTEEADLKAGQAETGGSIDRYDSEMDQASRNSQQAAEEAARKQEEQMKNQNPQGENNSSGDFFGSGTGQPEQSASPAQPAPSAQKPVNNPITVIKRIMKMGVLELVLPAGKGISANEIDKSTLVSGRQLQQGMKMPDGITAENGYSSGILFQQYLMNHLGNYSEPSSAGLAYQMEYIFAGKDNDVDNLKAVATKLLFIREGVNFACLMADNVKRSEAQALATLIASSFLVPPAAAVIESALLLCWAFAESVLDVRELFAGGKIPLVKTSAEWQISLENLPNLMEGLDSMRRNDEKGMSYEDYLQVLVLSVNKSKKVMRSMDMVENTIRSNGREHFYMDSCIVALEAFADVKANKKKEFQVIRQYCY